MRRCLNRRRHFFFFNDTATTEIYTLSLHDALPILGNGELRSGAPEREFVAANILEAGAEQRAAETERSEEHTSELQSRLHLVCRLLLEKKKTLFNLVVLNTDTSTVLKTEPSYTLRA